MEGSASVILFELGIVILNDTNQLVKATKFQDPASAFQSLSMGDKEELAEILPELDQFHTIRVNHNILMAILGSPRPKSRVIFTIRTGSNYGK